MATITKKELIDRIAEVGGDRRVNELGLRPGERDHLLRQLDHRELDRIAEVDGDAQDAGGRERLDEEINSFNAAVTEF